MDIIIDILSWVIGVGFIVFCIWASITRNSRLREKALRNRAREIEAGLEQEAIDMETRRKYAEKRLREAGETP